MTVVCSEHCQTSKIELFAEIGHGWKPLTIFTKMFGTMFATGLNNPLKHGNFL